MSFWFKAQSIFEVLIYYSDQRSWSDNWWLSCLYQQWKETICYTWKKKTPTASLLLNDKWPCFLSQHFWVSTNFDKIYIQKIWVCVFSLDANICAVFIFYFWSKKKTKKPPTHSLYHYILYYMSCLSTTPNRSQQLEQQSSFRVFLFLLQSVKASIPLSDDVCAHPLENNATGMLQSVCGNCSHYSWFMRQGVEVVVNAKPAFRVSLCSSKCVKRLLEVTQVSHHTFSAWLNATLLSHETVYTIKL